MGKAITGGSRSNRERSEDTRAKIIAAARALFVETGFAATATPDIVRAAGLTRGALYHHFDDKTDLFRAVIAAEAAAVRQAIEAGDDATDDPVTALLDGAERYLDAMAVPGRTRLLLSDGPAILGTAAMRRLDRDEAEATLAEGLAAAFDGQPPAGADLACLVDLLSAAFDRAALSIAAGESRHAYAGALKTLILALVARPAGG